MSIKLRGVFPEHMFSHGKKKNTSPRLVAKEHVTNDIFYLIWNELFPFLSYECINSTRRATKWYKE